MSAKRLTFAQTLSLVLSFLIPQTLMSFSVISVTSLNLKVSDQIQ